MADTTCAVCDEALHVRWTDTHGVGACRTCGLPYRIFHYENDVRFEKPPSIAISESWLPLAREYWADMHRRVFPGSFDMGIFRGRGDRTYSGATEDDMREFDEWLTARKDQWPQMVDEPVFVDAVGEASE